MRIHTLALAALPFVLLAATPCSAFDLNALKDLDRVKQAVSIGSKAVQANRDISPEEEAKIGKGVAAQVFGAAPLIDDEATQLYVNHVGRWLAMHTERAALDWRFGVVDSDDVNAFSMPGGIVLLTRGLYARLRNEGELAGVLAHEIAHVLQNDQLDAIRKQLGREWQLELVSAIASSKDEDNAEHYSKAFGAGTEVFARGLDKQDEFDADRYGVVIAARAGYNPYGLVSVLQTLGSINAQDSAVALMFKTHPAPATRLDELERAMGAQLDRYAAQVDVTKRFVPMPMAAPSDAAREKKKKDKGAG